MEEFEYIIKGNCPNCKVKFPYIDQCQNCGNLTCDENGICSSCGEVFNFVENCPSCNGTSKDENGYCVNCGYLTVSIGKKSYQITKVALVEKAELSHCECGTKHIIETYIERTFDNNNMNDKEI